MHSVLKMLTRSKILLVLLLAAIVVLVMVPGDAFAGPGGQFAKQLFKSRIGKIIGGIVLLLLAVVLLPLLLYVWVGQSLGVRKTRRDLTSLAERYPWFEWKYIDRKLRAAVNDIYGAWATGDLSPAAHHMSADYYGTQQDMLDRWRDEGKQNVIQLKRIVKTQPLSVRVEDDESMTWLRALVTVDLVDYLEQVSTGRVIKGEHAPQTGFDTVWWLIHDGEDWIVHAIESGDTSLSWARDKNLVDTSHLDAMPSAELPQAQPTRDVADVPKARPVSKPAPPVSKPASTDPAKND